MINQTQRNNKTTLTEDLQVRKRAFRLACKVPKKYFFSVYLQNRTDLPVIEAMDN